MQSLFLMNILMSFQPPLGIHTRIVSGANMRTRSTLLLGEPPLSGNFYHTTNVGTFSPKTVPYSYNRTKFYKNSDIPLNYYSSKYNAVKPGQNGHSKIYKTKVVKTNGRKMKVERIAQCSLGTFCNSFDLHYVIIGLEKQYLYSF